MDEDEDDMLFGQLGLLLHQLRFSRRALEDIERSTATYGSFAFTSALSSGASFGAPPLSATGALRVHVSNLTDLVPGGGLFGFIGSLLGGIGRFFGGLIGGIVGGTVSGITLPYLIYEVGRISDNIRNALRFLGLNLSDSDDPQSRRSSSNTQPAANETLVGQLRGIRSIVDALTALFTAASSGGDAAASNATSASTARGQQWMAVLNSTRALMDGIDRVIRGMILLVPILIGSLAVLIQRLDSMKLALVEIMQFAVRNTFLLRGVILTTIFDLIASGARLAASLLGIIAKAVETILGSVFRMIGHVLDGAIAAFRFLATGIQGTIDGLLRWLVDTLGAALVFLGDLRIFRVLVHIVRIIPAVLPPLYELIRGSSPPLTPAQLNDLRIAANLTLPGPTTTGSASIPFPPMPNPATLLASPASVATLRRELDQATRGLTGEVGGVFRTGAGSLNALGQRIDVAARSESLFSGERIRDLLDNVSTRSDQLAGALNSARDAAANRPATGLERIAEAYERWLSGSGLDSLLDNLERHFAARPPDHSDVTAQALATGATRPLATVDIEDVTIVIKAPEQTPAPRDPDEPMVVRADIGESTLQPSVHDLDRTLHRWQERGGSFLT
ncbi:MAG: hypothetical protein ACE37K_06190 [Planctomycetota bacterium]